MTVQKCDLAHYGIFNSGLTCFTGKHHHPKLSLLKHTLDTLTSDHCFQNVSVQTSYLEQGYLETVNSLYCSYCNTDTGLDAVRNT